MKIQDLDCNNSSFIELNLNEAADICGGFMSGVAYGAFLSNINRYGVSNYPGLGQVTRTRNGSYYSYDYDLVFELP